MEAIFEKFQSKPVAIAIKTSKKGTEIAIVLS